MLKLIWSLLTFAPIAISASFLLVFLIRLSNWIYLSIFSRGPIDLSSYGGRSRRSWALITGASDGIGAGFAKELAKQNFNLFLIGRNFEKLEKIRNEIENVNDMVKVALIISEASDLTLTNFENVFHEIEGTLKEFKGILRIFINNVGIGQGGKRRLGDIPINEQDGEDIFEDIVSVNCSYPVILTSVMLKHLRKNIGAYNMLPKGYDRVALLNVASCAALTPATPFSSLYAATKAFNRSFSISLSGELAAKRLLHPETIPIVDVLCVNPGFVVSNMTKMNESLFCCTAEEHAAVVFRKLSKSSKGFIADIVPHWKHGLIWSLMWLVEFILPWEWLLVGFIMPAILKFSGKYRNFKID